MAKKKAKFDIVVHKPKKLSNGMKSTNENWREFARLAFGDDSAAVKYMDGRIARGGSNASVREDEPVMKLLLATIHDHPEALAQAH
jgi:hypothetical protein